MAYIGFDFGSQSAKVVAVDDTLKLVYDDGLSYDRDLPEFRTVGGVNTNPESGEVTVSSARFIKALDILLDRMKEACIDFGKIKAISGNGRCGCVYWKYGARQKLQNLDVDKSMYDQLKDCFSIPDAYEWRDSTSGVQCRQLEEACGGPMNMARIVGSVAFEYIPGPQLLKVFQTQQEAYKNTEKISLLSSFHSSLFLGDYAPIDYGDGSISGLLNIWTKEWHPEFLHLFDESLLNKLGEIVPADQLLGNVSDYLIKKYNFSSDCKVVPFTQDQLDSLVGLTVKPDDIFISMGTGDGLLKIIPAPVPNHYSNLLISPLDPRKFVALMGYKNASRVRQGVMERCAGSWEKFAEMFYSTPPGNNGYIGMYFDVLEIVPEVKGTFLFDKENKRVDSLPPAVEVRAVIESQLIARRIYARRCGMEIGPKTRIIATGGASKNHTILQAIADIFNAPVYDIDEPNSAPLGGCYRAKLALAKCRDIQELKGLHEPVCAAKPTEGLQKVYGEMAARYEELEAQVVEQFVKT